jgi:cold shock CspA family protein
MRRAPIKERYDKLHVIDALKRKGRDVLGTVTWYDAIRNCGLLQAEFLRPVFIFHENIVMDGHKLLFPGQVCMFDLSENQKGYAAVNCRPFFDVEGTEIQGCIYRHFKDRAYGFLMGRDGIAYHFSSSQFMGDPAGFEIGSYVIFTPGVNDNGKEAMEIRICKEGEKSDRYNQVV